MKYITVSLRGAKMVYHYFQITMTTLYAFPTYISLTFVACFTCSNGLVCCVCDNVSGSDKAGFHAIEGYWEGVTANHRWA